jgi:hypothetical protein
MGKTIRKEGRRGAIMGNVQQALGAGIRLFFWSIQFFYRHPSLILLSLIPSTVRFIQMWNDLRTPFWMEIVVESTRVVLFFLIFALMSKSALRDVFGKEVWSRWNYSLKIELERNWPVVFLAQTAVFLIGFYWLMNSTLEWLLNPTFVNWLASIVGAASFDYDQFFTSALFFLKNISVIPLSIVYILRMLGAGIHA